MKSLDINQIKEYLPHRYPLLLVDRVIDWESGKTITAIKNVTINEEFFNGHFPHKPVMPGVLTIEALAQTAALLAFLTNGQKPDDNAVVYFVGIDGARFSVLSSRVISCACKWIYYGSRAASGSFMHAPR